MGWPMSCTITTQRSSGHTDRGKVERVIKMGEKHCFISNSLNGEVRLEPEIVVA